jgi:four helix bundle protein
MQDFRTMKVWEKSHQVTLEVYRVTRRFPTEERYGIVDQIRRAAVSV